VTGGGIIARRVEHIRSLCEEHDIVIEYSHDERGAAAPDRRAVLIPRTTLIRSYYTGLHEIAHCVLGYDMAKPAAPQEFQAWRWAFDHAIEPPSDGVKRQVFKVLWHYLLADLAGTNGVEDPALLLGNVTLFPPRTEVFWTFLGALDESGQLLYEATKILAHAGPVAVARANRIGTLEAQRRE
jgi:hypothetical protein